MRQKNLVWLFMDSLRFDTWSENDSAMKTDILRGGLHLSQCITQGAWTYPSVACFLSGMTAVSSGISIVDTGNAGVQKIKWPWLQEVTMAAMNPDVPTLFDYVALAGYDVLTAIAPVLSEGYNYANWNRMDEHWGTNIDQSLSWLSRRRDNPFCLFVRTTMTHSPWLQMPGAFDWERCKALIRELGQGRRIAEAKRMMADSLEKFDREYYVPIRQKLKDLGELDRTVFVIMSDHGDSIWECFDRLEVFDTTVGGGLIGHSNCYEETIHAVAGIWTPDMEPVSIDRMTRLIDLLPTVLPLLGLELPHGVDGVNLMDPEALSTIKTAPTEAHDRISVRTEKAKIIFSPKDKRWVCFDLHRDPCEMDPNLGRGHYDEMWTHLREYIGTDSFEDGVNIIDEEITRGRLQSLGYL